MDSHLQKCLKDLGIPFAENERSTRLLLLRVLLEESAQEPLSVKEIEMAYKRMNPEESVSETWVRRLLKRLVEDGLVKVESPKAYRKRYKADVNTMMAGIEKAKSACITRLETTLVETKSQLVEVKSIDPISIAQDLVEEITGSSQKVSSRFIRGLDEFNRVIESTIFSKAGPGDLIRASIISVQPLLKDVPERWAKNFEAVERGAELRYSIPHTLLNMDDALESRVPKEWMIETLKRIIEYKEKGLKIDVRINTGSLKMYQFVGLNNESIAFVITEDPMNAAWVTKDFNPDLINKAISTFDKNWDNCIPLLSLSKDILEKLDVSEESYLASAVKESSLNSD